MNLFSDIYSCYYQVMKKILCQNTSLSKKDLLHLIETDGFGESTLFLMPKILSGEWDFFEKEGDIMISKLSKNLSVPLSKLQKCYIRALLADEKMRLFFDEEQLARLETLFADYEPLWTTEDFFYYDRFADKDDFSNPDYISHFRSLLAAIKKRQWITILYEGRNGMHSHEMLPCRLEYSLKNDRFRLLATATPEDDVPQIHTFNLNRICEITLQEKHIAKMPDINYAIQKSYYKEPMRFLIKDERNALERAMLQFANYEKNTTRLDKDTYECCIYYNKNTETELLIEVLSFGPMIQVIGNKSFLAQLKRRLKKQKNLWCSQPQDK